MAAFLTTQTGAPDPPHTHTRTSPVQVLFMWCTLPAFGAAAYVPSLVLGEMAVKPYCGCSRLQPGFVQRVFLRAPVAHRP